VGHHLKQSSRFYRTCPAARSAKNREASAANLVTYWKARHDVDLQSGEDCAALASFFATAEVTSEPLIS
jgi:hypothetical protein